MHWCHIIWLSSSSRVVLCLATHAHICATTASQSGHHLSLPTTKSPTTTYVRACLPTTYCQHLYLLSRFIHACNNNDIVSRERRDWIDLTWNMDETWLWYCLFTWIRNTDRLRWCHSRREQQLNRRFCLFTVSHIHHTVPMMHSWKCRERKRERAKAVAHYTHTHCCSIQYAALWVRCSFRGRNDGIGPSVSLIIYQRSAVHRCCIV